MAGEAVDPNTFPPYSGQAPVCPKCGENGATANWVPSTLLLLTNGQVSWSASTNSGPDWPGWMLRYCSFCSWSWGEQTLDTPQAALRTAAKKPDPIPAKPVDTRTFVINQPHPPVLEIKGL